MKTKSVSLLIFFLICAPCFAQITIKDCYQKAQANYPLIKQYNLIEQTKEYNLSNANKGYLPQITVSAKATYQSEVTQLPVDFSQLGIPEMTIPTLSKDQYGASIDINQTIWDGGTISSQKEKLRAAAEVEKKNIEVNIYAVNERVNQLYFGILFTGEQIRQIELLQEELQNNHDKIKAFIQNGIALPSDLDAVKVEQLKAQQNKSRLNKTKIIYVTMLSMLIGEDLNEYTEFVKPEAIRPEIEQFKRPELYLFQAQIKNFEARNQEITAAVMPKLGLFVTGGYGKPGLNMLDNEFAPYYIGGVRLSWNIGSFYTQKNNRKQVQTGIASIETQRETFLFNLSIDATQKHNLIDTYFDQLKYDDEIIALRKSIKQSAETKMANGTITGSDLTRDINAEQMAIQDKILHETELLLAIYNLKFATNN